MDATEQVNQLLTECGATLKRDKGINPMTTEQSKLADDFDLVITIRVSLDEAETLRSCLDDADEEHLSAHVEYCITEAKQNAGLLQRK